MSLQFAESEIARARYRWDVIASDVALKRRGREFAGLCPFHSEKTPSFYVAPDKGFYHCFGCGAHGTAIDYVMRARGVDFMTAVRELLDLPPQRARDDAASPAKQTNRNDRSDDIAAILSGCEPITDRTAAQLYLWSRGLATRQPALLAHPALYCHEIRAPLPALVAPIRDRRGDITALQRIWVVPRIEGAMRDGRALLKTRKKTLGPMGDGAVRLRPAGPVLGLAEGVETAIAASMLYRCPVWAVCGAYRLGFPAHWREITPYGEPPTLWIDPVQPPVDVEARHVEARPPSVWIPPEATSLMIFGDRGAVGEVIAGFAADWWRGQGLEAQVVFPRSGFDDFNSELIGAPT